MSMRLPSTRGRTRMVMSSEKRRKRPRATAYPAGAAAPARPCRFQHLPAEAQRRPPGEIEGRVCRQFEQDRHGLGIGLPLHAPALRGDIGRNPPGARRQRRLRPAEGGRIVDIGRDIGKRRPGHQPHRDIACRSEQDQREQHRAGRLANAAMAGLPDADKGEDGEAERGEDENIGAGDRREAFDARLPQPHQQQRQEQHRTGKPRQPPAPDGRARNRFLEDETAVHALSCP